MANIDWGREMKSRRLCFASSSTDSFLRGWQNARRAVEYQGHFQREDKGAILQYRL